MRTPWELKGLSSHPAGPSHPLGFPKKGPKVQVQVLPRAMLFTHPLQLAKPSPHMHLAETTANTRRAFFVLSSAYKTRVKGHTGSSGSSCEAKSLRFDEPLSEEPLKAARKHRNRQRNSLDIRVVERCQFVRPKLSLCDSTLISVLLAAFF